ncbi:isoaspartyl peptidase/L-asparaginase [Alteriqipengyuania sp. NZ-12B]|uniref:Isoaspartyl peptidase/L-asparaginase n=1 Tax=Alteriqipengyuania abyssalis TaxID=2860200 RepID=A0ABS7PBN3_9SPHN|nr:isoaspartyl peptidase/L-asparaginase [Alteriqipengyuania abyssalis]MBY8336453.1 isoaspartyl peptidase/L-asparaginase [Alteriqipengyuania abyssalis]
MRAIIALALASFLTAPALAQEDYEPGEPRWSFAIHGGAGTIERANMTPEQEAEYRAALDAALEAGSAILRDGGSAMDAVTAAITLMEDDPKFNAGRGAVFTWDGTIEHDAALMDGRDRSAGAVTGIGTVRHPILLAQEVMRDGRHVFLSGAGAETFADGTDLERVPNEWFRTESRLRSLERLKAEKLSAIDVDYKYGTVGAVALDLDGNMAAGTSTGGLTGKRWGRIGDAPVIGAGTYADNRSCAVSATGAGEYFIRVGVAQAICSSLREEMIIKNMNMRREPSRNGIIIPTGQALTIEEEQNAIDQVLDEVKQLGGDGGVIVVTRFGSPLFSFNTPGMYRARSTSEGMREIAIFGEGE